MQKLLFWIFLFGLIGSCASLNQARFDSRENDPADKFESLDQKILYSAELSLSVSVVDSANLQIQQIAKSYGGFISEIGTQKSVIRVKAEQLEAAINAIVLLGKLQKKNIIGLNVTDEYYDYQVRLDNAQKARERYLQLLSQAENMEAALKVERELERLNEVIDLLTGRINRMDQFEKYSTITIYLKEKSKPGVFGYIGLGLYHAVKWLFVRK